MAAQAPPEGPVMILCDDGLGPYTTPYRALIGDIRRRHGIPESGDITAARDRTRLTINGIRCMIAFYGTHYCGYVLGGECDDDYVPHGGWTDVCGFDCTHLRDVRLPGEEEGCEAACEGRDSFKTFQFVTQELHRVTRSMVSKSAAAGNGAGGGGEGGAGGAEGGGEGEAGAGEGEGEGAQG